MGANHNNRIVRSQSDRGKEYSPSQRFGGSYACRLIALRPWSLIERVESTCQFAQPLRIAYESRAIADSSLAPLGDDAAIRLRAATATLARALCETGDVLARNVAATLAIEHYKRHGKSRADDRTQLWQGYWSRQRQGLSDPGARKNGRLRRQARDEWLPGLSCRLARKSLESRNFRRSSC